MGACSSKADAWLYIEVPSEVATTLYNVGMQQVHDSKLLPKESVKTCQVRPPASQMHVTVLTGLRSAPNLVNRVRRVVRRCNSVPIQLSTDMMQTFHTPGVRDVVHGNVLSPELWELHKLLTKEFQTPQTHAFAPHVTVAFCKPDTRSQDTMTDPYLRSLPLLTWTARRLVLQQEGEQTMTFIDLK